MAEWQGWIGLIGIALLIFDRASGGFGWIFGRANTEQSLRNDIAVLRRDVDRINERGSERNGELQRILGHIEVTLVENRKDIEGLRRDINGLEQRRNPR